MNAVTKTQAEPNLKTVELKPQTATTAEARAAKRPARRGRIVLMLALPLFLLLGGGYFWLSGGRYQETENANLHEARLSIASDLSGRVVSVAMADNQKVHAGDVLFELDPEPYRLAVNEADAALATARLKVEQTKATYRQSVAQEAVARDNVTFRQSELDRQAALSKRGVSTEAALEQAAFALSQAREELSAIEQSTATIAASLGGNAESQTDAHPSVRAALASKDRAIYNLGLATVLAPADGTIYQAASFRAGQFVAAGAPLFALVEDQDVWVDANFKESQLENISVGQSAELSFDMMPGQTFDAVVEAIGAGTGAEFSLLPAQNATGNWVKVTQRVPVRLRLTSDLPGGLSISGVSAKVSVDTEVSRSIFGQSLGFLN